MNGKILKTLNFHHICSEVAARSLSERGKILAKNLQPFTKEEEIFAAFSDLSDVELLERYDIHLPQFPLKDISAAIKRLRIGAILNGEELAAVLALLLACREVVGVAEQAEAYPLELAHLSKLFEKIEPLAELRRRLVLAIDESGRLLDSASSQLASIRRKILQEEDAIRTQLENIVKSSKAAKLSEALVTIRNERYVLPVKTEYRHAFGGVVHDQSASGRTLFIEPGSIVERNNHLNTLKQEEKQEIYRIYAELSAFIAPYAENLLVNSEVLAQLDFIMAKSRYGKAIHATRPTLVSSTDEIELKQARHPLLAPQKVVANDIRYQAPYRMIVITGPNTGGKTVTLRTLGLLQLMAQCGLFIPVESGSRLRVFQEIYADIGDEQSIEQNLSTFSGHMKNIISILEDACEETLVLIDELGSGTDPKEGAALAMAILNYLAKRRSTVMVTTHYPELKAYSFEKSFAKNASMTFDSETLTPTYHLLIGEPGRSNALDIAKRLGLKDSIITEAGLYMNHQEHNLNDMLQDLSNKRQQVKKTQESLEKSTQKAESLLADLASAHQAMQADRDTYLKRAKKEAEQLVTEAEAEAKELLKEIRTWQLQKGQAIIKEEQLQAKKEAMEELHKKVGKNPVLEQVQKQKEAARAEEKWKIGDEVIVSAYDQAGILIEKREKEQWLVQLGALQMVLDSKQFVKKNHKNQKASQDKVSVRATRAKSVTTSLDLRGERFDNAMHRLEQFIDSAILAKHAQVTIIHGHGTGALRKGVHAALRKDRRIYSFDYAPYHMGGQGATIVKLKED